MLHEKRDTFKATMMATRRPPMSATTDLNSRIALAKGWTWHEESFFLAPDFGTLPELRTHWLVPILDGERYAEPGIPPDYVGTLEGLAGLMREMAEAGRYCSWGYDIHTRMYNCIEDTEFFDDELMAESPPDRPGDCVGEAYLSMKEATHASAE